MKPRALLLGIISLALTPAGCFYDFEVPPSEEPTEAGGDAGTPDAGNDAPDDVSEEDFDADASDDVVTADVDAEAPEDAPDDVVSETSDVLADVTTELFTESSTVNQSTAGEELTINFTGLPESISQVTAEISLVGDYDDVAEYANIWIDSVSQTRHEGGNQNCAATGAVTSYEVGASTVADGALEVRIDTSVDVEPCAAPVNSRATVVISYFIVSP